MMNENVKIEVKAGKIVITIDPKVDLGPSASGKSNLVAKCREVVGDGVTMQLTAYRKR
jgi:hypothetical protein